MSSAPSPHEIAACLAGVLRDRILHPGVEFDHQTSLPGLGVDSLSYARLLIAVERRFGLEFPDEAMTPENLDTVESITRVFTQAPRGA